MNLELSPDELRVLLAALNRPAAERVSVFEAAIRAKMKRRIRAALAGPSPELTKALNTLLKEVPAGVNLAELRDDLAKLNGRPPYNDPANFCWNDNYFARSLVMKYGAGLDELEHWAKGGGR